MAKAKKTQVSDDLFAEIKEESTVKKTTKKVEPKVEQKVETNEEHKEEPKKVVRKVAPTSKFTDKDLIPCKSVTSGGLSFIGHSGNKYRWGNYGIVEYVEYGDLKREAQSANPTNFLFYPRFIVVDSDFVEEFPKLEEFYSKFYTDEGDFEKILNLPEEQMKEAIDKLPKGCKECLKGIVSTKIHEGTLDSVKKIKALDDIFATSMLLMLANN